MKYISLFSGIEAATVAWEPLGLEPVAFCEIDAFPSAVLAHRFPEVPNLGDITKVDWREYHGSIDVVVGGSPCQSFSIAGNREGLAGESGLMFEYIRAVREIMPRYFVWENVPGALSSEKGEAFGQLLSEMDALGYGLAWRVLDAQFFGVAQRRERVFLVGCIGDPERAAEILFERESLRWDSPSSREKRKSLASAVERGVGSGSGYGSFCIQGDIARGAHMGQNGKGFTETGECYTLNTIDVHAAAYTLKNCVHTLAFDKAQVEHERLFNPKLNPSNGEDYVGALCARDFKGVGNQYVSEGKILFSGNPEYIVRRLTPVECERLQGFPDGWTDVEYKGKNAHDGKRYKALGNSMAVPVMRWIGQRILCTEWGDSR